MVSLRNDFCVSLMHPMQAFLTFAEIFSDQVDTLFCCHYSKPVPAVLHARLSKIVPDRDFFALDGSLSDILNLSWLCIVCITV